MEQVLTRLTDKLKAAYGDRLVAVLLYGSAAAGDRQAAYSDYNVLCVLERIGTRELGESSPIFQWWRGLGNPAPLLLSEREVATCTDCFPIEFHDMQARRELLFGRDVVEGLEVDDKFYRAQVEHELRAKLLRLRQKAAGMLAEHDLLRRLLVDSISTFCVLFRHALLLDGIEADVRKREVVARSAARFGFDAAPFDKLLDLREERLRPRDADPVALLAGYLAGIEAVIEAVDRMDTR